MYRLSPATLLLAFLLLTACHTQRVAEAPETIVELTILQLNDVYEIAPLEGGKAGGLARVASLLRTLEMDNPNTIAILAGDFLSPTFMGNLKMDDGERIAGLQMVETLNALGLDYVTFGNHEFDLSSGALLEKRMAQSDFRYICANTFHKTPEGVRPFRQGDADVPSQVLHPVVQDGKTYNFAILGVCLPFNKADYVEYTDVTTTFRDQVTQARQSADVVLAMTHLNIDEDTLLAKAVPGVPLFMGGHDHTNMRFQIGGTTITKADANAKTVYVHRVRYNPARRTTEVTSELFVIDDKSAEDAATAAVVSKWQGDLNGLVMKMGYDPAQVLRQLTEPLIGTEALVRSTQTNYGLLANRAYQRAWPGADVYAFNSGSLRIDDNVSGVLTTYDLLRSFPYGGPIVEMEMTGAQLELLLNTGTTTNYGEGGYLQRLHADNPQGQWVIGGRPLHTSATYKVVLPQFVAAGREANLAWLADLPYTARETLSINGQSVKNDIRDIIIAHCTLPQR